jgi:hypothetical protein
MKVSIIKIGGNLIEDESVLKKVLQNFARLEGAKILVHGGGKLATQVSEKLGIATQMVDGRRITNRETLDVITMVYGGLTSCNYIDCAGTCANANAGWIGGEVNIEGLPPGEDICGNCGSYVQYNTIGEIVENDVAQTSIIGCSDVPSNCGTPVDNCGVSMDCNPESLGCTSDDETGWWYGAGGNYTCVEFQCQCNEVVPTCAGTEGECGTYDSTLSEACSVDTPLTSEDCGNCSTYQSAEVAYQCESNSCVCNGECCLTTYCQNNPDINDIINEEGNVIGGYPNSVTWYKSRTSTVTAVNAVCSGDAGAGVCSCLRNEPLISCINMGEDGAWSCNVIEYDDWLWKYDYIRLSRIWWDSR